MLFHNRQYKIKRFEQWSSGGLWTKGPFYCVYIPIYEGGPFGNRLDSNKIKYSSLKEAIQAMNDHFNSKEK
jgi:hypothetical protein